MGFRDYDTQKAYLNITSSTNAILTSTTIANGSFTPTGQPDFPRNITITVTTATISAGTVTVNGVGFNGALISEVLDLSAATSLTGTLNFISVTNIVVAGLTGADPADTFIVGVGTDIQLTVGNSILNTATVNSGTGAYHIIDGIISTDPAVAIISGATNKTYTYNCVMKLGIHITMAGTHPLTVTWTQ